MKRALICVCVCVLFCSCSLTPIRWHRGTSTVSVAVSSVEKTEKSGQPVEQKYNFDVIKAVWISYLELEPILKNKSKAAFTASFSEMMETVADLGLNTVIVQVRPFADALYPSDLYPPSHLYGDRTPNYDPLGIMLELAHRHKLSFHAWINPLRGQTTQQMQRVSTDYPTRQFYDQRKKSDLVSVLNGRVYLNPAYPQVRKLIADGAAEIVRKYNVDAIHIDDYFYPTTDKSFDRKAYAKYGKKRNLADFRRANCSSLVRELYAAVKAVDKQVLFGISPQGNVENNYASQYADVKTWCTESGYTDYILPQLYYGFKNTGSPFVETAETWRKLVDTHLVKLAAGLACHKVDLAVDAYAGNGKYEWAEDKTVLKRQIAYTNAKNGYDGFALFSYQSLHKLSKKQLQALRSAIQ